MCKGAVGEQAQAVRDAEGEAVARKLGCVRIGRAVEGVKKQGRGTSHSQQG